MSTLSETRGLKALHYLYSAREVADEMERLRTALTAAGRPADERRVLMEDFDDATVRLCNLILLAMSEIDKSGENPLRVRFDQLLGQVRGRWVTQHVLQVTERIRQIDDVVARTLSSGLCRLGLAHRLESAFAEVRAALNAMGVEPVEGLEPGYLDDLSSRISVLARNETTTFRMLDLDCPSGG